MPSTFGFFDRDIRLATADLQPAAINAALAKFARQSVAEVISSRQAPAEYERYVNGRKGAAEESVQAPGPIVYEFVAWKLVIEGALEELKKRVPRKTGRYQDSFLVTRNGSVVTDFNAIPPDGRIVILNAQPYTRKMETGANKTGARHFELSKAAFNRRFSGAFQAQTVYLKAQGGIDARVPYILKDSQGRRKDRQAGMPITYPSIEIVAL